MARVVVIGDLMTDAVARATLPLARGSDTPANVTMHGGGSGANIAAWMAADGGDVALVDVDEVLVDPAVGLRPVGVERLLVDAAADVLQVGECAGRLEHVVHDGGRAKPTGL